MSHIRIKPGLLDRLVKISGLTSDRNIAGAIGVSYDTYRRVRDDLQAPSVAFIAGVCDAFGMTPGEVVELSDTKAKTRIDQDAA